VPQPWEPFCDEGKQVTAMAVQPVDILLVEDNPDDAQLTLHVFQKSNISNRVQVVEDGADALDFLFHTGPYVNQEGTPRVVLLDLKLPKVSGLEVLRQIRSDPRTCKMPVVVLTSSREDVDIEACYELGVNSYIVKPVDFAQFGESVRQLGLYWLMLNRSPNK
jgi:two-component system response regulator